MCENIQSSHDTMGSGVQDTISLFTFIESQTPKSIWLIYIIKAILPLVPIFVVAEILPVDNTVCPWVFLLLAYHMLDLLGLYIPIPLQLRTPG
jgi:hypothetical protein